MAAGEFRIDDRVSLGLQHIPHTPGLSQLIVGITGLEQTDFEVEPDRQLRSRLELPYEPAERG